MSNLQPGCHAARGNAPQLDAQIDAGGRQKLAIGRKREGIEAKGIPLECRYHPPLCQIVESDRAILGPKGQDAAIGRDQLRRAVESLSPLERDVLWLRFGLDTGQPASLENTARRLGIGVRRARQVEGDALRRLATFPELESLLLAA